MDPKLGRELVDVLLMLSHHLRGFRGGCPSCGSRSIEFAERAIVLPLTGMLAWTPIGLAW
jgi:hypothetical protein